ncbi:MAG: C4-type zinc ribbon domain-containing protein [Verrucomicrobiota bacterium]|nr:C4-type zinc ribbon domain-containing protein [Verrucomicrobiota bacterium]
MLNVIENLLILQDRDRKLMRIEAEIASIEPQRHSVQSRARESQALLDQAKNKVKQIESDRKKLELDAEAKKAQIDKYASQQLLTKKNDEYRALASEIEHCREQIRALEDQQLELMEKAETAQKELQAVSQQVATAQKDVDSQVAALANREIALKKQLADLKTDYDKLEGAVEESVRSRYERLRKVKGGNTVVGIEHSVCGGCHMKLPTQIIRSCQGQQEIVSCPNCGRILYYSREMDLAAAD